MSEELTFIKQVKEGSRAAFNELYKVHYVSLCSYAKLFLDEEEAEDVVQDVFLNVWLHKERLDESQGLRGYLLRSVYHTALNVLKRKSYSATYCSAYEQEIEETVYRCYDPDASDVIRKLYNQELQAEIDAAIESLPPKCREVFSLSYLQDIPSKDISEQLGVSLRTVDNHIYAALKQLREKLAGCLSSFWTLIVSFI